MILESKIRIVCNFLNGWMLNVELSFNVKYSSLLVSIIICEMMLKEWNEMNESNLQNNKAKRSQQTIRRIKASLYFIGMGIKNWNDSKEKDMRQWECQKRKGTTQNKKNEHNLALNLFYMIEMRSVLPYRFPTFHCFNSSSDVEIALQYVQEW